MLEQVPEAWVEGLHWLLAESLQQVDDDQFLVLCVPLVP